MRKGFGIVELIISLSVGAIILWGVSSTLHSSKRTEVSRENATQITTELNTLAQTILQVGRDAEACTNIDTRTLRCTINSIQPKVASNNRQIRFQFIPDDRLVKYEQEDLPLGSNVWKLQKSYTDIDAFELCGDAEMLVGTCQIEPLELSLAHKKDIDTDGSDGYAAADPTPPLRFFRFRVVTYGKDLKTKPVRALEGASLQGAFYVRLPLPIPMSDPGKLGGAITYDWGQKRW